MSDNRYQKCQEHSGVHSIFFDLVENTFPRLAGYSFGLLFDTKKKVSKGFVRLAEIDLPGELLKYFAVDPKGNPFDFILIIDETAWSSASPEDRVRLIRHELRHVFIDEKGNAKLVRHDLEDFYAEVELNKDDPEWSRRLAQVTMDTYNQKHEEALEKKAGDRKRGRKAPPMSKWPVSSRRPANPAQANIL